jgi:DNA-binding NtrC family response regulator
LPGVAEMTSDDCLDGFARLNLVGESPAFVESLRLIRRVAACDATVLVQGETGTGKELAARALHYLGARRMAPFVPINCGAIPETLIESELFGHARGAFTDAREAKAGVIAQAEGGTLFLDELDALSARAQIALLRFLQDREYRPVGGRAVLGADVRIIGATNADLAALAARGQFRPDLLFRLNILVLDMPPLRARGRDVILLADAFVRRYAHQYGKPVASLCADSIAWLEHYDWPGNVRELENLVHRAVVLSEGPSIRLTPTAPAARAVDPSALTDLGFRAAKARAIADFERAYLAEVMFRTGGNISAAARLAGKERSRLGKLVKKYGLERSSFTPDR